MTSAAPIPTTENPLPATMRAVTFHRYGPPDVLRVETVAVPALRAGEVLVRVGAVAVGAADAALRAADPFVARLATGLRRPRRTVLGTEVAGTVVAVGAEVTEIRVGDHVAGATGIQMGGYAEYVRLPAVGLVRTPDGMSAADAVAVIEGGLTALPFLRDNGRVRPGQRVLVNGASGAVGSAAVQLAVHLGATVVGVCRGANADLVRSLGATEVVDRTTTDFTQAREAYDVVFDTVGTSSFRRSRRSLRPGGVYLTTAPSPVAMAQSVWVPGSRRVSVAFTGLRSQADKAADMTTLLDLAAQGAFRPVVDRRYPLGEASAAHRYVDTKGKRGVVVLEP